MSPRIPGFCLPALLLAPALLAAQQNPPVTKGEVTPTPAVLPAGALEKLRWIAGGWRGAGADGAAFYERYLFVDDSTFEVESFADSTLARVTETARYELRGGRLANVGTGPRWAAVRLDDSVASFVPLERARNRFEWRRVSADAWTAVIAWPTPQGPRERVYRLTRMSPRP
jgi:hypothetical protein